MKYSVTVSLSDKKIRFNNVEADSEGEAIRKAKKAAIDRLGFHVEPQSVADQRKAENFAKPNAASINVIEAIFGKWRP